MMCHLTMGLDAIPIKMPIGFFHWPWQWIYKFKWKSRDFPQGARSLSLTLGSKAWGVLHQEHEPEFLALKDSRACIQENQRLQETETLLLKGTFQIKSNWKGAWFRHICWSWRAFQRGKRQLDIDICLILETETLGLASTILESCF